MPGEKKPAQAISTCEFCGAAVSQDAQECQSCHQIITPKRGNPYPRKVPQKGETYKDLTPTPNQLYQGKPIISSKQAKRKEKHKDYAEHNKDTVKDEYVSEEFNMCADPQRKKTINVDKKEEVMRSCLDLEIDG